MEADAGRRDGTFDIGVSEATGMSFGVSDVFPALKGLSEECFLIWVVPRFFVPCRGLFLVYRNLKCPISILRVCKEGKPFVRRHSVKSADDFMVLQMYFASVRQAIFM